jgi:hypothetical protein
MGEEGAGIEAVRVMSGDNPFGGLPPSLKLTAGHAEVFARLRGVEVLREILAAMGASAFRRFYTVAQAMVHKTA